MIRASQLIDEARKRPLLGVVVLVLLVAVLVLAALHPALDALELICSLAVLALAAVAAASRPIPAGGPVAPVAGATSARPPTRTRPRRALATSTPLRL